MSWDNQILEINGDDEDMLQQALNLAFDQQGHLTTRYWRVERPLGLILLWSTLNIKGTNAFLTDMSANDVTPVVWNWVNEEINNRMGEYDFKHDDRFDGTIGTGWHLSRGNTDFIGDNCYRICIIRPEYLWYSK